MRSRILLVGILSMTVFSVFVFLFCNPPLDASSGPKVDIILESSTLVQDDDFLEDSLGNSIKIGITCFMPEDIDSATLFVSSPSGQTIIDTTFTFNNSLLYDTLWKTVIFYTPGIKNVTITPYSSLDLAPVGATVYIRDRKLPDNPEPSLSVSGNRIVRPSETCSLKIDISDPDESQKVSLTSGVLPEGAVLQGDTLLIWPVPESFTGEDTIVLTATDDGFPPAADTQQIIITVTRNPSSPTLTISGDRTLTPSTTCILLLDFRDADTGQTVTVTVADNPEGSSIVDGTIFMWEIPRDFIGRDTVIFTAADNGTPQKSITDTVVIIVTETETDFAPVWVSDTLTVEISDRENLDMNLNDSCSDEDGDALVFSVEGENSPVILDGSHVRYTPAEGTDTTLFITLRAEDGRDSVSTVVLSLTVTAVDETAPACMFIDPSGDSSSVNSPSVSITISATDASGIGNVLCSMRESRFETTHTDSLYTAIVTGLQQDVYNRIIFTVSDASDLDNTSTLILYVLYDPTMEDHTRPVVRRQHPATDSLTVGIPQTDISIIAGDVSGIASVTCKTGEQTPEVTSSDSIYSATITGLAEDVFTRILFTITDASSNGNRDSVVFYVRYDPTLNDTIPPEMTRDTPQNDSSSTASSTATLSVRAADPNGIASVVCLMGNQSFTVSESEGVYSAAVSGLAQQAYSTVLFIAADGSSNSNRDTIEFHLFFDPTLDDHTPPVVARHTPDHDTVTAGSAAVTLAITATDDNGIEAVTWSQNGTSHAVSSVESIYSARITDLEANQYTRIVFIAVDASSNHNTDSTIYHVYYDPTLNDETPPQLSRNNPDHDTSTSTGESVTLSINVSDESDIGEVICHLGTQSFNVSGNGPVYTAAVSGLSLNRYNRIVFTATDASANANRDSIDFHVLYDPTAEDHTGPTMFRYDPAVDSSTTDAPSADITIAAFDINGIMSITCSMNGTTFNTGPQGNNRYRASITGLTENVWNRIVFTATDGASSHNRDSVVYHIIYDRTANDNTPPVITTTDWPASGSTTANAQPTLSFTVADANGIDSVWWTLNSGSRSVLQPVPGAPYSFTVPLQHSPTNHIAVFATDNSSRHNRSAIALDLIYNRPPVPQARQISTPRDEPVSVTLIALDPDEDPVMQWKIVSGPYHGSISTSVPEFTYRPDEHFEGLDSIGFRAWDAYDSSTVIAYVVITIASNNVAPEITVPPQNIIADSGSTVTIAAEINANAYPAPTIEWLRNGTPVHTGSLFYTLSPIGYHDQGSYTLRVSNTAGSDDTTFTITVRDTIYPVLTILGSSETGIRLEEPWTDPGAVAVDDRDGNLTVHQNGSVDVNRTGRYEIEYSATDAAGNRSAARRVVYVEGWEHAAKLETSQYANILTRDNRFFVFGIDYADYTGKFLYVHDGVADTIRRFENIALPTIALGDDGNTPYIAYVDYSNESSEIVVERFTGNGWEMLIYAELPWQYGNFRYFLSLSISPDNRPYIATAFQDIEDANMNCYIWRINGNAERIYWEQVTSEDPSAFYGSFRMDIPGRDKNVLSFSSEGTPYIGGHNTDGQPICRRLEGNAWVPAAESEIISSIDHCVSNMHVLQSSTGDLFAGFAYCESSINPKIFRLTGTTWTQLPPMTTSRDGGGGFSMSVSPAGELHAVHNEGDNFIVRSFNGIEWHNVVEIAGDTAFTDDNCIDVSIAAGVNDCYVTYLKNVPGTEYPMMYIRKGYHHQ